MRRYVIVGTSIAGLAAAEAIRKVDASGTITLVGEEPHPYYYRPDLAYLVAGEIGEYELFAPSEKLASRLGVNQISGRRAVSITVPRHEVVLSDGRRLPYDRLLLATGSLALPIGLPGDALRGVVKLDNLEDARRLMRYGAKAQVAVILGGGVMALQLAEALQRRGLTVHYLLRSDRYWKNVLDRIESKVIEDRLAAQGIQIHRQAEPEEITGKRGRVTAVRLKDGRTIPCDLVAVATGVQPRKELAEQAGLLTSRGILVDEILQTNAPDIFAAGDVAEVYDPIFGKTLSDTLWWVARAQGSVAGRNMAGDCSPYEKPVSFNSVPLAGITTTIIGATGRGADESLHAITRGESETWRQLSNAVASRSDDDDDHLRIVVGDHSLLGAVLMGNQAAAGMLYGLISAQASIAPIRERLFRPSRPLLEILTEYWRNWRQQHLVQPFVWPLVEAPRTH